MVAAPLPQFSELGLSDPIYKAISEMGFEAPTPIQARAIPALLTGRDIIGQAQTGTGKTAAFALPLIQKLDPKVAKIQALVLAPTRELAIQVAGGIYDLSKHTGLKVTPVYGGQPIDRQFRALKSGPQIVVGTPGRVLDHLRRGSMSLADCAVGVLDEADEMMALGFAEDLEAILSELPESRQLAFFSATMPPKIISLTKKFLRNPEHISIEAKQRTVDTIEQTYYEVPKGKKLEALGRVLDMETPGATVVFCRTRQETHDLSEALRLRGYNAESLHGDMNQGERDRVMKRFRDGHADLLVATDVAARGLDIDTVTHVVNYDIPWDVEQYIHRIGRTGRAGRSGDAITLVEGKERRQLHVIERLIGTTIKPARIPTAADIAARRRDLFKDSLRETLEAGTYEAQIATVEDLLEDFAPAEVAAAALHLLWENQHSAGADPDGIGEDFEQPEAGMTRVFIGLGRRDGLRPGDVVGAIVGETGLPAKQIGVIDILDRTAFVEVPEGSADGVIDALRHTKLKGRKVKVQLARPGTEPAEEVRRPSYRRK
ncbi:MAG: RNA helicase [Armatimonadetes bacterium 55-13]|nr:MAG: RNA helicase [bacterium SCN 57-13]OJU64671.1 MAG: RNA helicase [Armatimonadetes bacterium 55-13]